MNDEVIIQAVYDFKSNKLHWIDLYENLVQEKLRFNDTTSWNAYLDNINFDRRKFAVLMRAYTYLEIKAADLLISRNFKGSVYAIAQLPKLVNYLENTSVPVTKIDDIIKKVLMGEIGEHSIRKIVGEIGEHSIRKIEPKNSIEQKDSYMSSLEIQKISSEQEKAIKSFIKMLETLDCLIDSTVSTAGLRKVRSETGNQCRVVAKKLLSVFNESYSSDEVIINL